MMKKHQSSAFFLALSFLLLTSAYNYERVQIPVGFPEIDYPEDNAYSKGRVELGEMLFFEKRFSIDGSISCASCHKPEFAFSDTTAFSKGARGERAERNTPSLLNVAYHPYFMREGGVPTLEMQILVPIQEKREFNHNIVLIANELKLDSAYQRMSKEAYGREMDPFVIERALAAYERTLISGNSPYDQYKFQGKEGALNESEKRGMNLFFSDQTNCSSCHSGFNFTNYDFKNNGLMTEYPDSGRMRLTNLEKDRALFKVPSLRNVSLTAPYMHNGQYSTLEEVIEHYDEGGKSHPQKDELIKPLGLSDEEKGELIAFLESLTDRSYQNKLNY